MIGLFPRRPEQLTCFLLLLTSTASSAQAPDTSVTATADKKTIELSQPLTVTLAVVGPAPLRVELPKQLLVPETERDWKIQPIGAATVTQLMGNRERWVQRFRLDPFDFGKSMAVVFAPLQVNDREVAGAEIVVTVEDPKLGLKPEESMAVTGIEHLPPPVPSDTSARWWWLFLIVPLIAAMLVFRRFRRPPRPLPPREWADAAFAKLERDAAGGPALVTAVAAIVRGFVERHFGIPAPRLTTEELLTAAEQASWPVEQTNPLRRLLEECDRAKFAGDVPDEDDCQRLLARGREWVELVSPDTQPK
jgi:hypothetical protein